MKNTESTITCPNCKKELGIGTTTVKAIEKDGHFYCKNCGAELGSTLDHPNAIAALEKPTDAYQTSYSDISPAKLLKGKSPAEMKSIIERFYDLTPVGRPETVTVAPKPPLQNIVIEVKKLKTKLEEMLLDQKLPAGSADVEIDDLTAAHNETNVKLARLGKLEEIESSAEKAEKDLSSAEEELTERERKKNVLEDDLDEEEQELAGKIAEYGEKMEGWEADKKYWLEHSQAPDAAEFLDESLTEADDANSAIAEGKDHQKKLKEEHTKALKEFNQAQKDYELTRTIAANMKSEREQLRNDIRTNLKPLAEKINILYRNFISARKSNKVVEKSTEIKNKLEELQKELNHTQDQTDEHKELVQHGIAKETISKINEIEITLRELIDKHRKLLDVHGWDDDRITSGIDLQKEVLHIQRTSSDQIDQLRKFFINKFNIDETKLVTDDEKSRLDLEIIIAMLRTERKTLHQRLRLVDIQDHNILADMMRGVLPISEITKILDGTPSITELRKRKVVTRRMAAHSKSWVEKQAQSIFKSDTPTPSEIQSDSVLVEEFKWISTLEIEFRKLVEIVFKNVENWWNELVPDNVRENARRNNDRNDDFSKWNKTQDFKLLGKLNFNGLTQIFTGVKCWNYFSPVFPKPTDYQQDWLFSVKSKLIDTGYCRNRIGHTHRLNDLSHEMLKGNYNFFIKCIIDFKNKNVAQ